ncbi:hypothetical protein [Hymenobacter terrestris]|uniref:Transmembrane protein n=1 Tax=Hymenobacter terrestris TaxID=2748310 RepID=A0ABX2Q664_9BACT|nr:hypothetical protein [Hymenobacter terrestris]NVO85257.1 hypothetical protein [Hymenobacter terrestris]
MSDRGYAWMVGLVGLALLVTAFGAINTQVSLKYELLNDPCISVISGRNLCDEYQHSKYFAVAMAALLLVLIGLRRQLVRRK